jgi:hypothetical protein
LSLRARKGAPGACQKIREIVCHYAKRLKRGSADVDFAGFEYIYIFFDCNQYDLFQDINASEYYSDSTAEVDRLNSILNDSVNETNINLNTVKLRCSLWIISGTLNCLLISFMQRAESIDEIILFFKLDMINNVY